MNEIDAKISSGEIVPGAEGQQAFLDVNRLPAPAGARAYGHSSEGKMSPSRSSCSLSSAASASAELIPAGGSLEATKKRKRRTSFTPQALEILTHFFERNTHPTGDTVCPPQVEQSWRPFCFVIYQLL